MCEAMFIGVCGSDSRTSFPRRDNNKSCYRSKGKKRYQIFFLKTFYLFCFVSMSDPYIILKSRR